MVQTTSGVRQGDFLSSISFNLASEPIIRKAIEIDGCDLFESKAKRTAYTDDIAIVIGSHQEIKSALYGILEVSSSRSLKFNPRLCTSISFNKVVIIITSYYNSITTIIISYYNTITSYYNTDPIGSVIYFGSRIY